MSKLIKRVSLLVATAALLPTIAGYRINMPLENDQGGSLPTGSIIIGQNNGNNNGNNDTDITGKVCTFDSLGTMVTLLKEAVGPFESGDKLYTYDGTIIGLYSPSNGYSGPPSGIARGATKESNPEFENYEICIDESKTYPTIPYPSDIGEPPIIPENPKEEPECIFNINSDYVAYNESTNQYIMYSVQFGVSATSNKWYYMPSDYDPQREGSYVYMDNDKLDYVNGPNPNYQYTGICRVKNFKILQ